jgi:hypothetical protein
LGIINIRRLLSGLHIIDAESVIKVHIGLCKDIYGNLMRKILAAGFLPMRSGT